MQELTLQIQHQPQQQQPQQQQLLQQQPLQQQPQQQPLQQQLLQQHSLQQQPLQQQPRQRQQLHQPLEQHIQQQPVQQLPLQQPPLQQPPLQQPPLQQPPLQQPPLQQLPPQQQLHYQSLQHPPQQQYEQRNQHPLLDDSSLLPLGIPSSSNNHLLQQNGLSSDIYQGQQSNGMQHDYSSYQFQQNEHVSASYLSYQIGETTPCEPSSHQVLPNEVNLQDTAIYQGDALHDALDVMRNESVNKDLYYGHVNMEGRGGRLKIFWNCSWLRNVVGKIFDIILLVD